MAAIASETDRNSALLDPQGILIPTGAISMSDRQTLVGDYFEGSSPPPPGATSQGGIVVTYIPMNR